MVNVYKFESDTEENCRLKCLDELDVYNNEILTKEYEEDGKYNMEVVKKEDIKDLQELESALESGKIGFFRIKYDLTTNEEFDGLIEKYKISRRCLDDKDPSYVFVAKSY